MEEILSPEMGSAGFPVSGPKVRFSMYRSVSGCVG